MNGNIAYNSKRQISATTLFGRKKKVTKWKYILWNGNLTHIHQNLEQITEEIPKPPTQVKEREHSVVTGIDMKSLARP